jgi:hypothetical protein
MQRYVVYCARANRHHRRNAVSVSETSKVLEILQEALMFGSKMIATSCSGSVHWGESTTDTADLPISSMGHDNYLCSSVSSVIRIHST